MVDILGKLVSTNIILYVIFIMVGDKLMGQRVAYVVFKYWGWAILLMVTLLVIGWIWT